ncbi:helix-turn-helix transcriptional regulator [Desulfallas sp. Bu1-1]|uniref:helix-turn-helix domain-containing protein n=1 Tax=Desulfallas sp. Bu1-1 TaxID=2787620 RepID=UPI00189F9A66|nr:helix-turn-helix transcriptional regulator [Desulfallas sp. Bu1-1]
MQKPPRMFGGGCDAKKLLLNTDKTIDEIAYSAGYNNNSYFTAVFKKFEKRTPSEFRVQERG